MTIGGSSSSRWSQIAAAPSSSPSPPSIASSVPSSLWSEDSDKVVGHNVNICSRHARSLPPVVAEDSNKVVVGHNVNSGRRPVWNKPSNASSSSVMGADSWPALTDSTKAPTRSPSESGTANMVPTPPQRASMKNMMSSQIQPRPYRHTNSHLSSNGGHPSQMPPPPPQGPMVAPVSQQQGRHQPCRAGFLANDHPQQRNSSRNRNVVPHQRGDGAHHNYGSRRDQVDRGSQDWNTLQNFNVRETYMTPRFVSTYMGPPPPPPAQLFAPPPPPPPQFVSPIGYRGMLC